MPTAGPKLGGHALDCELVDISSGNHDVTGGAARGISFGGAGDLRVVTAEGTTITIPSGALAAGIIHPLSVQQVVMTGTAATDIVVYF